MSTPLYSIPGTTAPSAPPARPQPAGPTRTGPSSASTARPPSAASTDEAARLAAPRSTPDAAPPRSVADVLATTGVASVIDELDADLIGLAPVKRRVREIAALLVIDRLRAAHGLASTAPSLHMCFTGNPGTGKTTVALRMARILHRLGYVRKDHVISVTRDDLVGQYIGHTAPKTKAVLDRAMGGVLFIDEAYWLYRPENERDYGVEAIELLLQTMENRRDDLVVILAGYRDRMDTFFSSNPGMASRIAHHVDFPDYAPDELLAIAERMLDAAQYRFGDGAREAFSAYLERRVAQPRFSNARSVRNALDRARLRQAHRLYSDPARELDARTLSTIEPPDILASRVFAPTPQETSR